MAEQELGSRAKRGQGDGTTIRGFVGETIDVFRRQYKRTEPHRTEPLCSGETRH